MLACVALDHFEQKKSMKTVLFSKENFNFIE